MNPSLPPHRAPDLTSPTAQQEVKNKSFEIADRGCVPREFLSKPNRTTNIKTRGGQSILTSSRETKPSVSPLSSDLGTSFLSPLKRIIPNYHSKFGIVGGTDNALFELNLRVWDVPVVRLPDGVRIHLKDRYLSAQFPILPYLNKELKDQFAREVTSMAQAHLHEGPFCFTSALQGVIWRRATTDDYVDSDLLEEAEELFQAKDLIIICWKTNVVIQRPSFSRELLFQAISQYCSPVSL